MTICWSDAGERPPFSSLVTMLNKRLGPSEIPPAPPGRMASKKLLSTSRLNSSSILVPRTSISPKHSEAGIGLFIESQIDRPVEELNDEHARMRSDPAYLVPMPLLESLALGDPQPNILEGTHALNNKVTDDDGESLLRSLLSLHPMHGSSESHHRVCLTSPLYHYIHTLR